MEEFWRLKGTNDRKTLGEWFNDERYPKESMRFRDWKDQKLVSEWEEDLDFALGLGMKIVLGGRQAKVPLKGIKWGKKNYVFPGREEILQHLRKFRGNIAAEMGRSNLIMLDVDRKKSKKKDWLFPFVGKTLTNYTPHGHHLFFWNDVWDTPIGHRGGRAIPVIDSSWLEEWRKENPTKLFALFSDADVSRIRNELAWIPPSETPFGRYEWREYRLPLLFSELLISLSKGRRS